MTEICVRVYEDLENTKQKLLKLGYEFEEFYANHDIYFTALTKNEVKKVGYKNLLKKSLIIRNIKGENLDIKNIVYKNKTLDDKGNVISEIKTKIKIDDVDKAKQVFANIGLNCWCDYVNENYAFKKGDVSLILQYVKELGVFLEIEEFKGMENLKSDEKFGVLKKIAESLELPLGDDFSAKKPYLFLTSDQTISKEK